MDDQTYERTDKRTVFVFPGGVKEIHSLQVCILLSRAVFTSALHIAIRKGPETILSVERARGNHTGAELHVGGRATVAEEVAAGKRANGILSEFFLKNPVSRNDAA